MDNNSSILKFLIGLATIVIILAGVKTASEILVPFLLATFISIICSTPLNWMVKRKIPYGLAIGILLLFIGAVLFFLVGLLGSTVQEFSQSIPQYRLLLGERVNTIIAFAQELNIPLTISRDTIMQHLDPSVIMNLVSRLLLGFSGVLTNIFVLLLVIIFMLMEAPYAKYKLAVAMSNKPEQITIEEHHLDRMLSSITGYLGVKTMMGLLTALTVWLLLEIVGVQYAILWAALCFLFNYIPNIGSIIAAVPIIVQAFLLNGFVAGLEVSIGVLVINMVIASFLEPRIMGKTLGLSTLVVFLSLLFWGWMLGTVGMLLSVPLTMAIKIMLESSPSTLKYAILLSDAKEIKPE